jgi:WD40 repeat protein
MPLTSGLFRIFAVITCLSSLVFVACNPFYSPPSSSGLLRTLGGHSQDVNSVSWSSDGKYLASAATDGQVKVWDASNWQTSKTLNGAGGFSIVSWSPGDKYLAAVSGDASKAVRVWDTTNWQEEWSLHWDYEVTALAWSSDGEKLAVGLESAPAQDWTGAWVRIYDVASWQNITTLDYPYGVFALAWSRVGNHLAVASVTQLGGAQSIVDKWNMGGRDTPTKEGRQIPAPNVNFSLDSLSWSPDGESLAAGYIDNAVRVWDTKSGQNTVTFIGHTATVKSVAWSPDGKRIASGSLDNTAKVWDVTTQQEIASFKHGDYVLSVAWSPDGKTLATACVDDYVYLWDIK